MNSIEWGECEDLRRSTERALVATGRRGFRATNRLVLASLILVALSTTTVGCDSERENPAVPAAPVAARDPVAPPSPVPSEPPRPTADDPSTWTQIRSPNLGFSIRMPPLDEPPNLEAVDNLDLYSRPEGMDGPWFSVSVHPTFRGTRPLRAPLEIERFLERQADVAVSFDPWGRPRYLGGGPETLYGHPGYATSEVVNEPYPGARLGSIRTRVVLVGERVFVLQARTRGPRPPSEAVDLFFSSFELLDEAAH